MPPSTKDFVLEQQKELLPGWSLSEPASSQEADAAPQTIDKALKALNKERQKQIHAQLNKNVANQLAMQLDALHEDRMTQKQARRSQAAQSGSVHVDTEQERCAYRFYPSKFKRTRLTQKVNKSTDGQTSSRLIGLMPTLRPKARSTKICSRRSKGLSRSKPS